MLIMMIMMMGPVNRILLETNWNCCFDIQHLMAISFIIMICFLWSNSNEKTTNPVCHKDNDCYNHNHRSNVMIMNNIMMVNMTFELLSIKIIWSFSIIPFHYEPKMKWNWILFIVIDWFFGHFWWSSDHHQRIRWFLFNFQSTKKETLTSGFFP